MDVIGLLQKKYAETGYVTVTEWMKDNKISMSLQSCTSVLLRGQDKGLVVMLTLASGLKCSTEEMQEIAKEKGDKTLWRLITKENVTKEESELLEHYRRCGQAQKKLMHGMLAEMCAGTPTGRRGSDKP